jgi:hypothetical protein
MSFVGKWMQLEIIMLSKQSQTEKDKYRQISHTFSHIWNLHTHIYVDIDIYIHKTYTIYTYSICIV